MLRLEYPLPQAVSISRIFRGWCQLLAFFMAPENSAFVARAYWLLNSHAGQIAQIRTRGRIPAFSGAGLDSSISPKKPQNRQVLEGTRRYTL